MKKIKNDRNKYVTRAGLVAGKHSHAGAHGTGQRQKKVRDFSNAPIDGVGYVNFRAVSSALSKEKA